VRYNQAKEILQDLLTDERVTNPKLDMIMLGDFNFRDVDFEECVDLDMTFTDLWKWKCVNVSEEEKIRKGEENWDKEKAGLTYDLTSNLMSKAISEKVRQMTGKIGNSSRFDRIYLRSHTELNSNIVNNDHQSKWTLLKNRQEKCLERLNDLEEAVGELEKLEHSSVNDSNNKVAFKQEWWRKREKRREKLWLEQSGKRWVGDNWCLKNMNLFGNECVHTGPLGEPVFLSDHFGLQAELIYQSPQIKQQID